MKTIVAAAASLAALQPLPGAAGPDEGPDAGSELALHSRVIRPGPADLEGLRAAAARAHGRSRIHALIRLDGIPSPARRAALSREGLFLLSYVPDRAWLASLPSDDIGRIVALPGVRWAGPLDPADKISPILRRGGFGGWAHDGSSGRCVVLVTLFRDVGLEEGEEAVRSLGGRVTGEAGLVHTLVAEIPVAAVEALAAHDIVEWIEQPLPPLEPVNAGNRAVVGADTLQAAPYNLAGSGVNVLVYDAGRVYGHSDLVARMTEGDSSPFHEHATHVACTVCGDGTVTFNNRGMAPAANLLSMGFEYDGSGVFLYTNPGDIEDDFTYAKNAWPPSADLLNASIGTNTAWNGFPCSYEGNYGVTDILLDSIVRGSLGEPFIMAWAAGNERGDGRCGSSYRTTAPPACAKNPIQSGATNESDGMSSFSSWGPTDDGRIKPVVCAPGVNVLSCNQSNGYRTMSGTSMASPTTAGVIALMLEQYRITYGTAVAFLPSSAKALLIHTAADLGPAGPDFRFGYGRIDAVAAADRIIARDLREEPATVHDETRDYAVTVAPGTPELRASLAWDDPPGTLMAVRKLVNDLDLELVAPGGAVHRPWVLDPANPSDTATTGADNLNNQEQVVVSGPAAGVWTVRVRASALPEPPQAYSIVFPGAADIAPAVTPGATPTPTPTPKVCYEAVTNGGFESGSDPWVLTGSAVRSAQQARSGSYSMRLGGPGNGRMHLEVGVPPSAAGATLSYWVRMQTAETDPDPDDFLDVEIHDGAGRTLTTLQSLSDRDPSYKDAWRQESFTLGSDLAGRTIRLHFQALVNNTMATYFFIDDVGLEICGSELPPTPAPTPTPAPNYINLSLSPVQLRPGGAVELSWRCDFSRWDYAGRPVDVYLAAIRDPKAAGASSSIGDALAGGEVRLFEDGMRTSYRFTGAVRAPCWRGVVFPPTPLAGTLRFTVPPDPSFHGDWVFATAFFLKDPPGPVRDDGLPVENSDIATVAP
ncbi:MAG: S8 family serine peptidase [bacterium]|nr:S8 family serine peptidase [bacterium]